MKSPRPERVPRAPKVPTMIETKGWMLNDYCRLYERLIRYWGQRVRVIPCMGGFGVYLFNGRRTTGSIAWGMTWIEAVVRGIPEGKRPVPRPVRRKGKKVAR